MHSPKPSFVATRWDGWTAARRHGFTTMLAETGHVGRAALAVGLSRVSAYRCRARNPDFAQAWDAALAGRDARRLAVPSAPGLFEQALAPPPDCASARRLDRALLARLLSWSARLPPEYAGCPPGAWNTTKLQPL